MRARRLPLRATAQYNKPRIIAAAKLSGLRRRLDARRVDLNAPSRHLWPIAAVGRVHTSIVTSCVRPVPGIRDQMEALGLEEGFSVGEEEELRSGHASYSKLNMARSQALSREIMLRSTPVRNDAAPLVAITAPTYFTLAEIIASVL